MTDTDDAALSDLPFVGFAKLRPGRIHCFCPGCGRKLSNGWRDEGDEWRPADPPDAVLVHAYCERCSEGCKDAPVSFWNKDGKRIETDDD